jgi:8-oxo-dGTP diphosphatase
VDIAILSLREGKLVARFIRVDRPPFFDGIPGLPGGLIQPKETAEDAARRLIREKAGIRPDLVHLEQLYTFSQVDRDPRGRVVAVGYSAYVPWDKLSTSERGDTDSCWWDTVPLRGPLAYDHRTILKVALERLRARSGYTTIVSKLIPREFTLTELEQAYQAIIGTQLDKRNFRKKLKKLDLLKDMDKVKAGERWRPARLYSFKSPQVQNIEIL